MNKNVSKLDERCGCGAAGTQKLIEKTLLLADKDHCEAGDVWNSKTIKYLCDECSNLHFKTEEEKKRSVKEAHFLLDKLEACLERIKGIGAKWAKSN